MLVLARQLNVNNLVCLSVIEHSGGRPYRPGTSVFFFGGRGSGSRLSAHSDIFHATFGQTEQTNGGENGIPAAKVIEIINIS